MRKSGKSDSLSAGHRRVFRAPGRVNLIGEHTDYNDGFVLPIAINFSTWVSLTPLDQRKLEIFSENFGEYIEFSLDEHSPTCKGHWSDYVIGVAVTLEKSGYPLRGARLSLSGEVPIGSGLSSSAALEVATAYALAANSNLDISRAEMAQLCRSAENEFVGARVGIMDQFVSLHGRAQKALLLDCRSLDYKLLPLSDSTRFVVCNTMVKHALASGAYNERRAQCEAGVAFLARKSPGVKALRDVTIDQLERDGLDLPEVIFRRCRHVVTENARVLEAAESLGRRDLNRFGELMYESHRSLRDDFAVSCPELDLMVDLARDVEGVYGGRLTGGGFGGCTVNLVALEHVEEFKERVSGAYERVMKLKPETYVLEAANGAEEVAVEAEGKG
jgi:galactokinase